MWRSYGGLFHWKSLEISQGIGYRISYNMTQYENMNLWGSHAFFVIAFFDFCCFIAYIIVMLQTFDSNFTHRPLAGRCFLFFLKETCLRNQRGLLTNSQKTTWKKACFCLGGRRVSQKFFRSPKLPWWCTVLLPFKEKKWVSFSCQMSCLSWDLREKFILRHWPIWTIHVIKDFKWL